MRIVFFGTPEFAVPALEALASEHEVVLVVAQPDRPAGRGLKLQSPAVAIRARELGLLVEQPQKIRTPEFLARLAAASPEVGVVVAYGKILPAALLAIPRHGFLNIHGSILPRWRGAAPIQRAIEAGDRVSGVTIMQVDAELDHGPILAIAETGIGPDEHTPELARRLAEIGAAALLPVLRAIENGTATATEQEHASATIAAKLEKQEGEVRFDESARSIYDRYRAFDPWPGVFVVSAGEPLRLTRLAPAEGSGPPRTLLSIDEQGVVVAAGDGAIRLIEAQRPGKPRTPAAALARGLGWRVGGLLP